MRRKIIILVLAVCWLVVVASPLRLGMARLGPVARAEGPTAAPAGQLPQDDPIPPEAVQRLGGRGFLPGVTAIDNAVLKLLKTMRWRDAHDRVAPLLQRLGLGERLRHRAEHLSMGERQRVMIARALSTEPRLLLADEPTGSLDSQRGREVLELLRELCRERGVAIVLVSHDPQAAAYADRVYALRDGSLGDYEPDRLARPAVS